ncbi:MAG: GNAT family N-acetyltransferase [Lachnospiraceae bacterium]|nr:GNAT family N-acetyltransferase [Lachnospiraceae bacterium]
MLLRKYKPSDCRELTELFYNTVHSVNAKDYTQEQLNAWAAANVDLEKWNASLSAHDCVVAVENGIILGFGDMDETGYLDRLYVHKDYQKMGIAAAICDRLEAAAPVSEFVTYASITAKPFFKKRGYRVIKENQAERQGVILLNYIMKKESTL